MAFGCLASVALWLVLASIALESVAPLGIGLAWIAGLVVHRGLRSEWPLY